MRSAYAAASSRVAWAVWPSCQRNSVVRRNSRGRSSQRTTLAHWLSSRGRSRWDWIHLANRWLTTVSEVGRTTSGSASFSPPPWVTTASSGENPSTCCCSFSRKLMGMNSGKYAFWTPVALIRRSRSACMSSQVAHAHGRMTMLPRAGPFSASSARATTSWYHWGKSFPWGVSTASLATMGSASLSLTGSERSLLEQGPGQRPAVGGGQGVVVAQQAEDVQHQPPGLVAGVAGALADGVQEGGQGRVGLAVGGLGGRGGKAGGRVGGLGGQAGAGQQDRHLGVGLDRAEQLDRLGRAALAQGQIDQAGPGGQVVGVLLQDLAPAGGGLGGVEVGRRGRGPVGVAGQQGLDEPLDDGGGLGADELVDQAAPGERLHRRDALDLEGHGQPLVLADIDPGQDDLAAVALHRPLQHRGQGVAGAAPVGPEVDQHGDGLGTFKHLGLEGGLGDVIDKIGHTVLGTPGLVTPASWPDVPRRPYGVPRTPPGSSWSACSSRWATANRSMTSATVISPRVWWWPVPAMAWASRRSSRARTVATPSSIRPRRRRGSSRRSRSMASTRPGSDLTRPNSSWRPAATSSACWAQ